MKYTDETIENFFQFVKGSAPASPVRILHTVCGTGELTSLLIRNWPQSQYTVCDPEQERLKSCLAMNERDITRSFVIETDHPLPVNGFDLVLTLEGLCAAENPERALRNLFAALKPGGILCTAIPTVNAMAFKMHFAEMFSDVLYQNAGELIFMKGTREG